MEPLSVTPVFLRWIAMRRFSPLLVMGGLLLGAPAADAQASAGLCLDQDLASLRRNATEHELRCRFAAFGPGRGFRGRS